MKNHKISKKRLLIAIVVTATVTVVLEFFVIRQPSVIRNVFLFPTANLSALFLGTPCIEMDDGSYLLPSRLQEITVIPECSGSHFWMVLYLMAQFMLILRLKGKRLAWYSAAALPVTLSVGWLINAVRINTAFWFQVLLKKSLHPELMNLVHYWAGMAIFLPALVLSYYLIMRRIRYEY